MRGQLKNMPTPLPKRTTEQQPTNDNLVQSKALENLPAILQQTNTLKTLSKTRQRTTEATHTLYIRGEIVIFVALLIIAWTIFFVHKIYLGHY